MNISINPISYLSNTINFKQKQSSTIDSHIKQIMSENFNDMLTSAKQEARKTIKDEFYTDFNQRIEDNIKSVKPIDTRNILNSLIEAYRNAALEWDVNALNNYIKSKNL